MELYAVDPGKFFLTCQIPTLPGTIASCLHLGGASPPHWVFQGFFVLDKYLGEMEGGVTSFWGETEGGVGGGGGGWWAHSPAHASLGKMALEGQCGISWH